MSKLRLEVGGAKELEELDKEIGELQFKLGNLDAEGCPNKLMDLLAERDDMLFFGLDELYQARFKKLEEKIAAERAKFE